MGSYFTLDLLLLLAGTHHLLIKMFSAFFSHSVTTENKNRLTMSRLEVLRSPFSSEVRSSHRFILQYDKKTNWNNRNTVILTVTSLPQSLCSSLVWSLAGNSPSHMLLCISVCWRFRVVYLTLCQSLLLITALRSSTEG